MVAEIARMNISCQYTLFSHEEVMYFIRQNVTKMINSSIMMNETEYCCISCGWFQIRTWKLKSTNNELAQHFSLSYVNEWAFPFVVAENKYTFLQGISGENKNIFLSFLRSTNNGSSFGIISDTVEIFPFLNLTCGLVWISVAQRTK